MKIDYKHVDNMGKRFIRKDFKCLSCFRRCKKLVHILINKIQCPYCYSDNCQEILFIKSNNDNAEIDNSSLKTNISQKDEESSPFNSSNNILYQNLILKENKDNSNKEKIKNSFLNKKKLLENIKPFSASPFSKSVHRHDFDLSDIFEDNSLSTIPYDFFMDNFCSKIKTMNPLNPKEIKLLKKFEMSENFCKKNKNDYELANCIYCLKDILLETNCFLLRCGHLIHENCLFEWIKEHKICPVCKYNLVKRGMAKKSSLDLIIDDSIREKEKIEKIFPVKDKINENGIVNIKNNNEKDFYDDINKFINEEDNNINIIGEKIREMNLSFEGE